MKEAAMSAKPFPARKYVVLAAALAIGAPACGSGGLDKAGGAVSKPVVLTLADGETDTSNAQPFAAAVSRLSHGTSSGHWARSRSSRSDRIPGKASPG